MSPKVGDIFITKEQDVLELVEKLESSYEPFNLFFKLLVKGSYYDSAYYDKPLNRANINPSYSFFISSYMPAPNLTKLLFLGE